jgi:hypothetical protein
MTSCRGYYQLAKKKNIELSLLHFKTARLKFSIYTESNAIWIHLIFLNVPSYFIYHLIAKTEAQR